MERPSQPRRKCFPSLFQGWWPDTTVPETDLQITLVYFGTLAARFKPLPATPQFLRYSFGPLSLHHSTSFLSPYPVELLLSLLSCSFLKHPCRGRDRWFVSR